VATINWDTVATAGATAILVTLAVEYLAKPMLEARKERILDGFQARRDLLTLITKMTLAARKYGERLPDGADRELHRTWNEERERHYNLMRQYAQQLSVDLDRYARAYNPAVTDLIVAYGFSVHAIVLSRRPRHRQAALIAELGEPMETFVQVPPPWRALAWDRAQKQVRQLITKIEDASVPAPSASSPDTTAPGQARS
jgi:hypothetical protein